MNFPHLTHTDGSYLDQVQLTGLLESSVIGILPNERHRKQPVTIDLCLYLSTQKAAQSTSIHDTIDYGAALQEMKYILEQCEFLLIESAVEVICQFFISTYRSEHRLPQVEAVMVRISKPTALSYGVIPAVQILRHRFQYEPMDHNQRDLYRQGDRALALIPIAGGASWHCPPNTCSIMSLGRLLVDSRAIATDHSRGQPAEAPQPIPTSLKPRTRLDGVALHGISLSNPHPHSELILAMVQTPRD